MFYICVMMTQIVTKSIIENAWNDRALLSKSETLKAIESVLNDLDNGHLRVAEPSSDGWQVNEWVKKAVVTVLPYSAKWKQLKWDRLSFTIRFH